MCCLLLLFSDEALDVGVPPFCGGLGEPREDWSDVWCEEVTTAPPTEGGGGTDGGTAAPGGGPPPDEDRSSEVSLQTAIGAGCVGGISMV